MNAAHFAILRLPLQQWRRQPGALRRGLGLLVFALLPAAIFTTTVGLGWGGFAAGYALTWLTLLWWRQVDGLQTQNRPQLARLLPGAGGGAAPQAWWFRRCSLRWPPAWSLPPASASPGRWLVWVLALQLLIAWLHREPLLWLPVSFGTTPLFYGMREAQQLASAPLAAQAVALLVWALLLGASLGSGGRWHRWQQKPAARLAAAAAARTPGPAAAVGAAGGTTALAGPLLQRAATPVRTLAAARSHPGQCAGAAGSRAGQRRPLADPARGDRAAGRGPGRGRGLGERRATVRWTGRRSSTTAASACASAASAPPAARCSAAPVRCGHGVASSPCWSCCPACRQKRARRWSGAGCASTCSAGAWPL